MVTPSTNTRRAAKKDVVKKIGDEVKVAKGADVVVGPDGGAASVRSGGTYRFAAPGKYVIGKARADGNGITGTTYFVK